MSDTTTATTNNLEYPEKAIKQLWRLVAQKATKQVWQCNYIKEQRRLKAAATPQLLWDIWSDLCQTAENYYYKQLFHTAPITVYMIIKPTAATATYHENRPCHSTHMDSEWQMWHSG